MIEGEVVRGGITVGLVRRSPVDIGRQPDDRDDRAGSSPCCRRASTGEYGVLLENGLFDSWFLRHAPLSLLQLAGRFHDFNDVRITKAGWISAGA